MGSRFTKRSARGSKRLEMIMRDTLSGLEDLAILSRWESGPFEMEILAIESPDAPADLDARAGGDPVAEPVPLSYCKHAG